MTGFPNGWRDRAEAAAAKKEAANDPAEISRRAEIRRQRGAILSALEEDREAQRASEAKMVRNPAATISAIIQKLPPDDLATILDATRYGMDWSALAFELSKLRVILDAKRDKQRPHSA